MFEQPVAELTQPVQHLLILRLSTFRGRVVVGQLGDTLVTAHLVVVLHHHHLDGSLDGATVERRDVLSPLMRVIHVHDIGIEHLLFLHAVVVKILKAVAEMIRDFVELMVTTVHVELQVVDLCAILARIAVMKLQHVIDQQIKVPLLERYSLRNLRFIHNK